MVIDEEARKTTRRLVQRLETIAAQGLAVAYVLARHDARQYEQLLRAAEVAEETVIRPLDDADESMRQVYAALDDPTADWAHAVNAKLDQGAICSHGDEALARLRFMQELDERFDAKMKAQIQKQGEEGASD